MKDKSKSKHPRRKDNLVLAPGGLRPKDSVHSVRSDEVVQFGEGKRTIRSLLNPVRAADAAQLRSQGLVLTPGGYRHPSLVHQVDKGEILRITGKAITIHDKKMALRRTVDLLQPKTGPIPALGSGWISYTSWTNSTGTPVSSFSTSWVVPPAPSTKGSQTVFLFNGISPSNRSKAILQPVLQWGPSHAGGGKYWSIASWYVEGGGDAFHTKPIRVKPGDELVGLMTLTGQANGRFSYRSEFSGFANSALTIQDVDELVWCNETLEAYSVQHCSDYPNAPYTAFRQIQILTGASIPVLNWSPQRAVTDCGQHAVTISNASPGGEVDLHYREGPAFIVGCGNKLFAIDGNVLRRVRPGDGAVEGQGPDNDWPQPRHMTALGNKLFVIDAGQGGRLWRADPATLVNDGVGPENDWPQPRCMTALGNRLFVIDAGQGGRLWRADPATLVNDGVGPENDWPQPRCMTALGNKLFVIDGGQGGRLWRVDPATLANDGVGPENDWPQPRCMTALGNKLFVIDGGQGGSLWLVDVNTLRAQQVVPR